MTILLKQLFNMLKLLNSETGEKQIALGVALGMIMGFSPAFSLQTLLVVIVLFFFRVQMGAAFVGAFVFAIIGFILDPLFHIAGVFFLELGFLQGLYTYLYNIPLVPFSKFYNSIVMGALVLSVVFFPLVYWGSKVLVLKYRETILKKIQGTRLYKAIKATKFYNWYLKYNELYG